MGEKVACRVSVVTSTRPKVVEGRFRHLLLWTDSFAPDLANAAMAFTNEPDVERGIGRLFARLDLTYAIVAVESLSGTITMAAGYNNLYPLYFCQDADGIVIKDALPCTSADERLQHLDQSGFADFVARAVVAGPFELSIDTLTFDRRWRTVPPGQRLAISPDGRTLRCDVANHVFQGIHDAIPPLGQAVDELREAIDLRLVSLAQHGLVASEFSGGIDSSIVRARCLARIASRYRGGVTCRFPYLEFARESEMQDAVLMHAPGAVTTVDHRGFLPFSKLSEVPWHASPTLASTAWGTFASVARAARQVGAHVLLSGHGGDTLFRWHPEQKLQYGLPADVARWLPPSLCREVTARAHDIAIGLNAGPGEGFGGLWHPGLFDPCYPTALLRSGVPGVHYVSGLISRDVLRAAARLWLADPPRDEQIQKAFACSVFRSDLPDALWRRPGKVDHLGIVYRGSIAARQDILRVAERSNELLDALGLPQAMFPAFAEAATRGIDSGNPMFSIMLAVSLWAGQKKPGTPEREVREQDKRYEAQIFIGKGGDDAKKCLKVFPCIQPSRINS